MWHLSNLALVRALSLHQVETAGASSTLAPRPSPQAPRASRRAVAAAAAGGAVLRPAAVR